MEKQQLDPRPEGVYCQWVTEKLVGGGVFRQLKIERVNGDASVDTFTCTDEDREAGVIREFLKAGE